jgi:hypothetical protein
MYQTLGYNDTFWALKIRNKLSMGGFTPAILATWEAEIWRTVVQGQPGENFAWPHFQNNQSKMD